jgi:hypothetical protein
MLRAVNSAENPARKSPYMSQKPGMNSCRNYCPWLNEPLESSFDLRFGFSAKFYPRKVIHLLNNNFKF